MHRTIRHILICSICCSVLSIGCTNKNCNELVELRDKHAVEDLECIYSRVDLPNRPLTLEDIIDIAWTHNYEALAKELEWEVEKELTTSEMLQMLPNLTINAERSKRNNSTAATAFVPSTHMLAPAEIGSAERVNIWDITFNFRILDFAIAYYRSSAEAWRALGVYMQYTRLKQNLVLSIYKSYWRAISARAVIGKSLEMLDLISEFRKKFDKNIDLRLLSVVPALKIEDQLLGFQVQFYDLDLQYLSAKTELAEFMGLPADIEFELAPVEMIPPPCLEPVEFLEETALRYRPELYGGDFEEAMAADEVRQAIIPLLPNAEIFKSYHFNADKFLVHHYWIVTGWRIAYELLGIPSKVFNISSAKFNEDRAYYARLAVAVAVLTQVRVSYTNYQIAYDQYDIRSDVANVRKRLADATNDEFVQGEFNEVDVVLARANALQGEIDAIRAYGELQVQLEQLNNSIGQPLRYTTFAQPINVPYEEDMWESSLECTDGEFKEL